MSSPEPREDQDPAAQAAETADDDSVVSPPAYPAYSVPPPEGLAGNEDG
ncbi:hypothetical protein [Mycobacterium asiaticum]|nr:hypothetical protein [Mycobacterium asiaticum]